MRSAIFLAIFVFSSCSSLTLTRSPSSQVECESVFSQPTALGGSKNFGINSEWRTIDVMQEPNPEAYSEQSGYRYYYGHKLSDYDQKVSKKSSNLIKLQEGSANIGTSRPY